MNYYRLCLLVSIIAIAIISSFGITIAANDKETDEKEEAVSLKQLPAAVKATLLREILREVDGLRIEELVRETEDGKVVYEIEIEYKDKDIELEIAANGKLLAKEVERDDDDDE